ncbi:hypothetical protein [Tenacibaculum sp. IB213877]|uniref:hypothetical protein n=1 Tax=Tenacibaculum sp. IB213877 TaxID=3097351 RepID=UPI002A5AC225|nr:hypothetical protein [Tenacibaculum sp. IB213877]MDY0781320.1 hypothetical protein [Tenacibaculum sp. IB213877]
MNLIWILIPIIIIVNLLLQSFFNSSKDFSELIRSELTKHKLEFISSNYPGIFKVGPFKKFEIDIKPQINHGAIQYEKTYYRIVKLKDRKGKIKEVWTKIDTTWFAKTKIEFKPSLDKIKK